jgi:hypothetical protein
MNLRCLGSLIVLAAATAQPAMSQCGKPATLDSLLAEVASHTIVFDVGGFGRVLGEPTVVSRRTIEALDVEVLTVDLSSSRWMILSRHRIAVKEGRAYRLRGWACSDLEILLESLTPLDVSGETEIWRAITSLAVLMNPVGWVGDSLKVYDPAGRIRLPSFQRTAVDPATPPDTLDDMFAPPVLEPRDDGTWYGELDILWHNVGYHGLRVVRWRFVLTSDGRIARLYESDLIPGPGCDLIRE